VLEGNDSYYLISTKIVVAKLLVKCQRPKKKCWRELKIVANMGLHINGVKPYNYST
jgi:hypothetical protein